jgi:hypothetical protein
MTEHFNPAAIIAKLEPGALSGRRTGTDLVRAILEAADAVPAERLRRELTACQEHHERTINKAREQRDAAREQLQGAVTRIRELEAIAADAISVIEHLIPGAGTERDYARMNAEELRKLLNRGPS